jgi:hypothetical protein
MFRHLSALFTACLTIFGNYAIIFITTTLMYEVAIRHKAWDDTEFVVEIASFALLRFVPTDASFLCNKVVLREKLQTNTLYIIQLILGA